ncbi:MAG: amino acid ABC transporter ATP-binding protein [Firmicutes bacterium]|nr:amino acid ABC transporter ATP-binding protein [Bacillota bacterium]
MIKIVNLEKYFGNLHILKNINLQIFQGEKVVILGPSGSGKSTLVRCINFLEKPTSGKIFINNLEVTSCSKTINKVRQSIAMVFQNFNLYPHKTIIENLILAPTIVQKVKKEEAIRTGMDYLKKVKLENKAFCYPCQLSGGQKQRAAIARALNMHPEVILLDEPTSSLDPEMIKEVLSVMNLMAEISSKIITMLIVTHEMTFAKKIADRIVFMDEGRIIEENNPIDFFENPTMDRTKQFLNKF